MPAASITRFGTIEVLKIASTLIPPSQTYIRNHFSSYPVIASRNRSEGFEMLQFGHDPGCEHANRAHKILLGKRPKVELAEHNLEHSESGGLPYLLCKRTRP